MAKDIYIVAGDEMLKIMKRKNPERDIIPFREDFSKGTYSGYDFTAEFIANRANNFGVSKEEYKAGIAPIINLDFSANYILYFGEDDCCKANLAFLLNYFKEHKYQKTLKIRIVDERSLEIIREYIA